ncbi:Annexin-B12-like [Homarus americanus]|uniref:Annexin-B12-like n=1 Tax=Homarus americanus TaxID=6706 RepID=A0A8J5JZA2_HOMAM|nr:Annexin-B12-like [Homarus americanus]
MDTHEGTIKLKEDFDPEKPCVRFRKAMKGMGTDTNVIIKMLVTHQNIQRQEYIEKYKAMYGRDLKEDLKEELGGTFEEAVLALLEGPYDLLYGISLDEHLVSELSGDFKNLMCALVAAGRDENQTVDTPSAISDAQLLYDAGVGMNSETDEEEFIRILNTRSFPQLKEVFNQYETLAAAPIEDALGEEFSGDMKNGLLAIGEFLFMIWPEAYSTAAGEAIILYYCRSSAGEGSTGVLR